jgi:hypothetical protein
MPATDQVFFVTGRKLKFRRGRVLDLILCKIVEMTKRGFKLPQIEANPIGFTIKKTPVNAKHMANCRVKTQNYVTKCRYQPFFKR